MESQDKNRSTLLYGEHPTSEAFMEDGTTKKMVRSFMRDERIKKFAVYGFLVGVLIGSGISYSLLYEFGMKRHMQTCLKRGNTKQACEAVLHYRSSETD